jgi:hypothetical protein
VQGHNAHTERARNFALQFPLPRQITCLRQFRRDLYPGVPFVSRHGGQLRRWGNMCNSITKNGHFASDNTCKRLRCSKVPVICWRNLDFVVALTRKTPRINPLTLLSRNLADYRLRDAVALVAC